MMSAVKPSFRKNSTLMQRIKESLVRKPEDRQQELKEVLKSLAESSSLHGVPKIVSSPQVAVKVLWSLLWLVTFGFLCFQIYTLISTYTSKPIDTSVSLEFSELSFPAITICNMNPVMSSKMDEKELIKKRTPKRTKRDLTNKHEDLWDALKTQYTKESLIRETADNSLKETIFPTPVQQESLIDNDVIELHPSEYPNKAEFMKNLEIIEKMLLSRNPRAASSSSSAPASSSGAASSSSPAQASSPDAASSPASSSDAASSSSPAQASSPDAASSPASSSDAASSSSPAPASSSGASDASYSSPSSSTYWWYDYDYNYDYFNDYDNYSSYSYDDDGPNIRELFSGSRDGWEMQRRTFEYNFKSMPVENRTQIGHSIEDMVLSMTFLGINRDVSQFKQLPTSEYGNCYTLDDDMYVAWRSGPLNGISITLNLQMDEYQSKFASGYGVRIVFHEKGTFPLPAVQGITLSPGTDNNVALKKVVMSRLGKPYAICRDGADFLEKYGFKYSSAACMQICRTNVVVSKCDCLPFDAPELKGWEGIEICNVTNRTVEGCVLVNADGALARKEIICDCPVPCSETVYEKTLSWRQWPNREYMENVLINKMCKRNMTSEGNIKNELKDGYCVGADGTNTTCNITRNICTDDVMLDVNEWQKNFLRVQVYFEDLNYELIEQKPSYEFVRFISDIGGAMGLFMGASILSLVEFLQLSMEVCMWAYEKQKRRQKRNPTIEVAPIDTIEGKLNSKESYI